MTSEEGNSFIHGEFMTVLSNRQLGWLLGGEMRKT